MSVFKIIKKFIILFILKNNREYSLNEIEHISRIYKLELIEILDDLVKNNLLNCRIENNFSNYPKQVLFYHYRKTVIANEYLFKSILKFLTTLLVIIYYLKEIFCN